jgi:hypothetical protein
MLKPDAVYVFESYYMPVELNIYEMNILSEEYGQKSELWVWGIRTVQELRGLRKTP